MKFVIYVKPQPQGSAKAFVHGKRAIITSANRKLTPFRNEVTSVVMQACEKEGIAIPLYEKHAPVTVSIACYFERPPSIPKKRVAMVVKPDLDKLARSVLDSCSGVLFVDDAQVVGLEIGKYYGFPERVEIEIHRS